MNLLPVHLLIPFVGYEAFRLHISLKLQESDKRNNLFNFHPILVLLFSARMKNRLASVKRLSKTTQTKSTVRRKSKCYALGV